MELTIYCNIGTEWHTDIESRIVKKNRSKNQMIMYLSGKNKRKHPETLK